jgi:hypothetical protein
MAEQPSRRAKRQKPNAPRHAPHLGPLLGKTTGNFHLI